MTKYKEYFKKMLEANKELFEEFQKLHDLYALDEEKWQEKFNQDGKKVLAVVHEWENRLCSHSEKAGYGNYTTGLAEKFQAEVKKAFPMIDHVGIIAKKPASPAGGEPEFILKKITLS